MLALCAAAAGIGVALVALIIGYTVVQGASALNLDFLTQGFKPLGETGGGMRDEIFGTLILVTMGTIFAVPAGLMAGICLSEFAGPKLATAVRFTADILAGVPSIVVGMFTYALMIFIEPKHTFSALSGGISLAIIMIPVIARTAEEALRLVPNGQREAALALGITRWRATLGVIVPGAITGIVTGVMLGVARIAGETAPLIFTAFGNQFGVQGLLKPIGALPLSIYRYAISPYQDWHRQAWAAAFLLIMLVLGISLLVRWISSRKRAVS